jgi:hypothetical protein
MNEYAKLLNKKEDLHKDLVEYVEQGSMFPMLRHPIIFCVPYFEQMNALTNKRYVEIKERVKQSLEEKDYKRYVWLHERPYRFNAFVEVKDNFSDEDYWETLADVWTDSENIHQNQLRWKELFESDRKNKQSFMSEDDLKFFNDLPEEITVYRGCTDGLNEEGFSYTTERDQAEWFANRFSKANPKVIERTIKKEEVFAYTNSRGENEIIIID